MTQPQTVRETDHVAEALDLLAAPGVVGAGGSVRGNPTPGLIAVAQVHATLALARATERQAAAVERLLALVQSQLDEQGPQQ